MDSKLGSTQLQTSLPYEEFEPLCTWQRDDNQDMLVIHLPEFKKEQLRIQISSTGIMKITGENVIEGKRSRFQKEVKVTKDYDSDNIHAKFSQGRLRITLPKKASKTSMYDPVSVTPSLQDDRDDNNDTDGTIVTPGTKSKVGQVLRSKKFAQVMVNVCLVVVMGLSVYSAYKYWASYVSVDEDVDVDE